MVQFKDYNFSEPLSKAVESMGFETPTLIQEKSITPILKGSDVLGQSATGSGKTLAFGAGVIDNIRAGEGVQAVILTPTRELAEQVKKVIIDMAKYTNLSITAIYGGVSIEPQMDSLKKADIVVATPGRFKDHLGRSTIDTSNVKVAVLDEADRMLEMGFIEDVSDILNACPKDRQMMFFSATFPPEIASLAEKHLNAPEKIVATRMVDPSKLQQYYYDVQKSHKFSLLLHLLKEETSKLVMVFCNTRKTVDFVVTNLKAQGVDATAIHGGFTQNKRTNTMDTFKDGKSTVLVCTDVAARGIHVDNISHIYNYEIPKNPNDYIHRIGRTARAGEEGKVINLICDLDYDNFSKIFNEFREYNIKKIEKPYVNLVPIKKPETDDRKKPPHGRKGSGKGFGRPSGRGRRFSGKNRGGSRSTQIPDERPRKSFGNRDSYGPRENSGQGPRGGFRNNSRNDHGGSKGGRGKQKNFRPKGKPSRGKNNRR